VIEPIEWVVIDRLEKPLQPVPEPGIRCERARYAIGRNRRIPSYDFKCCF
jgi:hypothetical protein